LIASHDISLINKMGYRSLQLSQGELVTNNG